MKWLILYKKEAEPDLAFFTEQYPDIWSEIRRIMYSLSRENDPRNPQNPNLKVAMIEYDAPGWWRIYVGKPGPLWVRVIFRLIGIRKGKPVEIERLDKVDEFDEPKAIEITYAAFRKDAYGKRLRERYKSR